MWWLLLSGCFGVYPFINEPPRLVSVNGVVVDPKVDWMSDLPPFVPGEDYPLEIEVEEPEKQRVEIYFPASYGEVEFEPDARKGVWHVPEEVPQFVRLYINLRDPKDEDREYQVEFRGRDGENFLAFDTGWWPF